MTVKTMNFSLDAALQKALNPFKKQVKSLREIIANIEREQYFEPLNRSNIEPDITR